MYFAVAVMKFILIAFLTLMPQSNILNALYLVRILKKSIFLNFIFVMYIHSKVYTQNFK